MNDHDLRDAEQRWRRSGAPADAHAYRSALIRAGALSREGLELGAFCGHPEVTAFLGVEACIELASYVGGYGAARVVFGEFGDIDLRAWLHALPRWGHLVVRSMWLAVGRRSFAVHAARFAGADPAPGPVLRDLEEWVASGTFPSPEQQRRLLPNGGNLDPDDDGLEPAYELVWSAIASALWSTTATRPGDLAWEIDWLCERLDAVPPGIADVVAAIRSELCARIDRDLLSATPGRPT